MLASGNQHLDAVIGTLLGAATTVPLAAGAVDDAPGTPWWAKWVGALAITLAPIVMKAIVAIVTKRDPDADADPAKAAPGKAGDPSSSSSSSTPSTKDK